MKLTSTAPFADRIRQELNPPQAEAALYTGGPLLVLAGAGSGKTRVITYRIAYLIHDCGLSPWNVLAVTFTNKAAGEMKDRVAGLVGGSPRGLWIGTFHSICSRILRTDGKAIGLDPHFTIYDRSDQLSTVKRVMKDCGIASQEAKPNSILNAISRAKSRFEWPDLFAANAKNYFEDLVSRVYRRYQDTLRVNKALDFDDLLMESVRLLKENEEIRRGYQKRFQHVLVDEYQDTNQPQYLLLRELRRDCPHICVVGDDDQSIYKWRGADLRNILEFQDQYPNAKIVRLEQNYRSSKVIISAATEMIGANKGRLGKTLWTAKEDGDPIGVIRLPDDSAEAYWVCDEIQRLHSQKNLAFRDFAVFYRTNAQSRQFEEECIRRGVPYNIVSGLAFYERMEIKDALAYARLLVNPSDRVSFERVVNVPKRKLGAVTVSKLIDYADRSKKNILRAAWDTASDRGSGLSAAAAAAFHQFADVFRYCHSRAAELTLAELFNELLNRSGYRAYWEAESDPQSDARLENIDELINAASQFEADIRRNEGSQPIDSIMMLEGFLENATLVSDQDSVNENEDKVSFMTIHAAKGLEFPCVFMVGMEEQLFPHQRSLDEPNDLEEERRLCYVGVTRAKVKLYLSHVESRRQHGRFEWAQPSRFIEEIPSRYREELSWRGADHLKHPYPTDNFTIHDELIVQEDASFQSGDMVNHRSFGFGVVLGVEGEGGKARITVDFQNVGQKILIQEYARLQKV